MRRSSPRSVPSAGRARSIPPSRLRSLAAHGVRLSNGSRARFRRATLKDVSTVARFRRALFEEMEEHSAESLDRYDPVFTKWYVRELRAGRLTGVVAESESGMPIATGLAWLQPRHPSPRFPHTELPYILQVYTVPDARRRGVAAAIVEALVEEARTNGYPRVLLHATRSGRSVYERLGFEATSEMRIEFPRSGLSATARTKRRGRQHAR